VAQVGECGCEAVSLRDRGVGFGPNRFERCVERRAASLFTP
jgi:hypothetical protein